MNLQLIRNTRKSYGIAFLAAAGLAVPGPAFGTPVCDDDGGAYVCVNKSGADPVEGTDFNFDFTDADNPDVEFLTGDLEWEVWSQASSSDTTPANLGDLTLDPTVDSDDFVVKIANGASAGAVDVASIVLDDDDFTGFSSIESGSHISGDLTGALTVVEDSGGGGGVVDGLTIDGDIDGTVTIPTVKLLVVNGDLNGAMNIGEIVDSGGSNDLYIVGDVTADIVVDNMVEGNLEVDGTVQSGVEVRIKDMQSDPLVPADGSVVSLGSASIDPFAGTLLLDNGVPSYQYVAVVGFDGEIDLNDEDVGGELTLTLGGSGDIVNGGAVTAAGAGASDGIVYLSSLSSSDFSGTATFASVEDGGTIEITSASSDLTGQLHIDGNVAGTIDISGAIGPGVAKGVLIDGILAYQTGVGDSPGSVLVGDTGANAMAGNILIAAFTEEGSVEIAGTCTGLIAVASSVDGEISVGGDLSNEILVAQVAGEIDIVGDMLSGGVISIVGPCSGLVHVGGDLKGGVDIRVAGDLSGTLDVDGWSGGDITIGVGSTGSVTSDGTIDVGSDLGGDIDVKDDMDGLIAVGGKLESTGRILIAGLCDGDVTIQDETEVYSLIRITEGIDEHSLITVNDGETNGLDAGGTIHIGPVVTPGGLPDITFDGAILIKAGPTSGGDLDGSITVKGCHATEHDLDICICGTAEDPAITITQDGCSNQVDTSCVSGCP